MERQELKVKRVKIETCTPRSEKKRARERNGVSV